jgi:(1->4)-alpha-D-glucan 1-alpha-D-glucosylmutase
VEDSALYVYNRLISLNEVGSSPDSTDLSLASFNKAMQVRHQKWPFSMNATMTHDAKRSEDVRARINVLSELPQEWERHLNDWSAWNACKSRKVKGIRAPERNEETLLYQTLLGSWPVEDTACACYIRRIQDFMIKAVREAMVHTRWTIPNLEHEQALVDFVHAILRESPENRFLQDFKPFARKIAYHGALNSLSQFVVKLASPGVADFYQGTESWDLRLVDPDNRQPVNFHQRREMLASLEHGSATLANLLANWEDGRVKMYVMKHGLQFRKSHASLLLKGDYFPMQVEGPHQDCVIAFARRFRGDWSLVVAPRFTSRLFGADGRLIPVNPGHETRVVLPKEAPKQWFPIFEDQGQTLESTDNTLVLGDVFRSFPVALLCNTHKAPHEED